MNNSGDPLERLLKRGNKQESQIQSLAQNLHQSEPDQQRKILAEAKKMLFRERLGEAAVLSHEIFNSIFPQLSSKVVIEELFNATVDDAHTQELKKQYEFDDVFLRRHIPEYWDSYYLKLLQFSKESLWRRSEFEKVFIDQIQSNIDNMSDSYRMHQLFTILRATCQLHGTDMAEFISFGHGSPKRSVETAKFSEKAHNLFERLKSIKGTSYLFHLLCEQYDARIQHQLTHLNSYAEPDDAYERWYSEVKPFRLSGTEFAVLTERGGYPVVLAVSGSEARDIENYLVEKESIQAEFNDIRSQKDRVLDQYTTDRNPEYLPYQEYDWYRAKTPVEQRMYEIVTAIEKMFFVQTSAALRPVPREDRILDLGALLNDAPNKPQEFWAAFFDPSIRLRILQDTEIDLSAIPIREQMFFYDFASKMMDDDVDKLRYFTKGFGKNGIRTFLAASVDPKVGDEILSFAKASDPERVRAVFSMFAEFADKIELLESYLEEKFGHAEESAVHEATGRLLRRGRDLLKDAHAHKDDPEALERLIVSLDTETRIFGDLARLYIDRGYALKDIVGVDVRSITGGALKGDLRRELTKMHREGYEKSGEYSRQQIDNLERGLEEKFDEPSSVFKVVIETKIDKLLAALRFDLEIDEKGDVSSVYLASVMSDGNLEGSRIGLLNVETQIKAQLEEHDAPITAVANPHVPITSKYLEMGFVVTGVKLSSDEKPLFKLEMRKDRLDSFTSIGSRASESAIASAAKRGAVSPDGSVARIPSSTLEEVLAKFANLQKEDPAWCITRYVRDKSSKESPRYFAVFERSTSLKT